MDDKNLDALVSVGQLKRFKQGTDKLYARKGTGILSPEKGCMLHSFRAHGKMEIEGTPSLDSPAKIKVGRGRNLIVVSIGNATFDDDGCVVDVGGNKDIVTEAVCIGRVEKGKTYAMFNGDTDLFGSYQYSIFEDEPVMDSGTRPVEHHLRAENVFTSPIDGWVAFWVDAPSDNVPMLEEAPVSSVTSNGESVDAGCFGLEIRNKNLCRLWVGVFPSDCSAGDKVTAMQPPLIPPYSGYAKVEPGKTYTVSRNVGEKFIVGVSSVFPVPEPAKVEEVVGPFRSSNSKESTSITEFEILVNDPSMCEYTFTTGENVHFVCVNVSDNPSPGTVVPSSYGAFLQIEEGDEATRYVDPFETLVPIELKPVMADVNGETDEVRIDHDGSVYFRPRTSLIVVDMDTDDGPYVRLDGGLDFGDTSLDLIRTSDGKNLYAIGPIKLPNMGPEDVLTDFVCEYFTPGNIDIDDPATWVVGEAAFTGGGFVMVSDEDESAFWGKLGTFGIYLPAKHAHDEYYDLWKELPEAALKLIEVWNEVFPNEGMTVSIPELETGVVGYYADEMFPILDSLKGLSKSGIEIPPLEN